jgi:hypothetical protein
VTAIDPRWWRFASAGTAPMSMLERSEHFAAMGVILDAGGERIGALGLAGLTGAASTAVLDIHVLPGHEEDGRRIAVLAAQAAFNGSPIDHLYTERFDDDPDLFTDMADAWKLEVRLPEFARVDGRYADRLISGISRAEFEGWFEGLPLA